MMTTGYNRTIWVFRKKDEAFLEDCLAPRFRIWAGVMCWSMIWKGGWSPLIRLDTKTSKGKKKGFTAELYVEQILKPVLKPWWEEFRVSVAVEAAR
jgi:hypothetical protein